MTMPAQTVNRYRGGTRWSRRPADLLFTVLGGPLLTVTGILLQARGLSFFDTGWVLKGAGSLALATLTWLLFLLRDQLRLKRLESNDEGTLRRIFLRWAIIGWAATAILFYGLWAMVTRQ